MADSDRSRMAELIRKSPANHEYFFEKLDDPAWLNVLTEEEFFRDPPEPERGDDWIRFPTWAESRYLVRIAAGAPAEVLDIVTRWPETENVRVHEDVLRIAAQLPGKMAARLARQEAAWLANYRGHVLSLPDASADLLVHLARENQVPAAFELAHALLEVVPADTDASSRHRAGARVSEYEYGLIIKEAWPALMEADPARAFSFLADRLSDVVQIGFTHANTYDSTSTWRPAIESHAQNLGHSLLDTLVDALRDHGVDAARTPEGLELVLNELDKHSEKVFQRLAIHTLRERGSIRAVAAALRDTDLAYDTRVWHEYGELLRARFGDLTREQQDPVLDVIDRGPELELTEELRARGTTTDDLARHKRYWQLERYSLIAEYLTGESARNYEALKSEFGEPDHPTFLTYSRSWTGPTSPFSTEELKTMGPRGVAQALRDWMPAEGHEDPSPEGLGRVLREVVSADADEFASAAGEFTGLEATYVRALLDGFADAAKEGRTFQWDPVLLLSAWVVAQPREDADSEGVYERDPHWGWARKQVASLLSNGFTEGDTQIPFLERERVWTLLAAVVDDPDPTPEHEERYGGDNMDPATLSINTTRGEALHAVFRYTLWVERELEACGDFEGMTSLPEVTELLERHVEPAFEPSLAIRSVYGQWFPQLVRMDRAFAERLAPKVFPSDPLVSAYFDAAWNAYVVFNRAFTDVFGVLRDAYALAIERLAETSGREPLAGDPRERLGDHLLTYRIVGTMSATDDDLFAQFWRTAPHDLRKQVLNEVGWSLGQTSELEQDVRDGLAATWEWIYAEADDDDLEPLASFGAWFGTRALEGRWVLAQGRAVLERGIHLEPSFEVYRALPRLASEDPGEAIEVLRRMVMTDAEGWSLSGSTDQVREALRIALEADSATASRAESVVHLLGARGMTMFRDLLPAN